MKTRILRGLGMILTALVVANGLLLFVSPAKHASATVQTVLTMQFDDGNADVYQALSMLSSHGMHATFYVNTGVIGDSAHMSWTQLQDLFAAGNDIAGHTLTHESLKKLKYADAHYQVCQDRDNMLSHGLQSTAFAYPFGSFDSSTEQVVKDCGYNSGRSVSGVNDTKVYAETIPPLDPYATRTPPNPKQGTTLATIESYVTAAEQHGGGWVQLVFHHICDSCDAYSITAANFQSLLDWLHPRSATGTIRRENARLPLACHLPYSERHASAAFEDERNCQSSFLTVHFIPYFRSGRHILSAHSWQRAVDYPGRLRSRWGRGIRVDPVHVSRDKSTRRHALFAMGETQFYLCRSHRRDARILGIPIVNRLLGRYAGVQINQRWEQYQCVTRSYIEPINDGK